jgi:oligoendopeptidase F
MSQKKNPGAKLAYNQMTDLPTLSDIKTNWDLAALYYTSELDPRIEQDIKYIIASYQKFTKKWRAAAFTTDIAVLASALKDYEQMVADPRLSKPGRYFSLRAELDVTDSAADKAMATIQKRVRPAADGMLFSYCSGTDSVPLFSSAAL